MYWSQEEHNTGTNIHYNGKDNCIMHTKNNLGKKIALLSYY